MGSGKSTLGRRLAECLGWTFVDLDVALELQQGDSIRNIIARHGEKDFRDLELETLRRHVAAPPQACVTATGGGLIEVPEARPLLAALGQVVWLRADPEVCVARLGAATATRPFLDADGDWRARYQRRESLYAQLAQHVVETHPASEESSLAALVRYVGDRVDAPDGG